MISHEKWKVKEKRQKMEKEVKQMMRKWNRKNMRNELPVQCSTEMKREGERGLENPSVQIILIHGKGVGGGGSSNPFTVKLSCPTTLGVIQAVLKTYICIYSLVGEVLESKKKTFCKHFVWAKQLHDGIWITI